MRDDEKSDARSQSMRVVFFAPTFPPEMIQYTRGLAEVGPGAEHAVDGPDQDDACVGLLLGEIQSVEELGHQLAGERVAVVR
jgi:hypothetical protein